MVPTITTYSKLALVATFADGDTRTITLDNPLDTVGKTEINALNSLMSGVLIGDKYGADFYNIGEAKKTDGTQTIMTF